MMEQKIVFTFFRNGKKVILKEPEYGVVDYEGLE